MSFGLFVGASGDRRGPAPRLTVSGAPGVALPAIVRGSGGPGAPRARRLLALLSVRTAWGPECGRVAEPLLRWSCSAVVAALGEWRVAPPELLTRAWDWSPSEYGSCPLCGLGEGGAEHLMLWCPAVALAWCALAPGCGRLLGKVVVGAEGPVDAAAMLIHQARF